MISLTQLQILPQYIVPQHGLSRFIGSLINIKNNKIKNWAIDKFIERYKVNMADAIETNPHNYSDFNSFFTRHLRPETRPIIAGDKTLACPCDGQLSEFGHINDKTILQAKHHDYSVKELLGGSEKLASQFINGEFATFYLAPKDYHRVHIPLTGKLTEMIYVPGKLFSVNLKTADHVPNLFARNERVICLFDTAAGPCAVILVGAMIVASIHTVWQGEIAPSRNSQIQTWFYNDPHKNIELNKGDELGHFQLGSTVIILFGNNAMRWSESLAVGQSVKMGQLIGNLY